MNPLFACSRCFKRYPFEEIFTTSGNDEMFCGDCRNATAKSKCTYCRSEYQQSGKPQTHSACPKCQANLKLGLRPKACSLCSINAAFKSDKCSRCTSSIIKYGPAVKCEICQQMCAFNREDHKLDGKLHCWLCRLSYKRALAKAKKSDSDKHKHRKRSAEEALKSNSSHKLTNSGSSHNRGGNSQRSELSKGLGETPEKISKTGIAMIPSNSDQSNYVVAITQLREQIATLQKKLQQKDNQLLQKDKEITEWKGKHFTIETEMRNKMKDQEKIYDAKLDVMNKKVQLQLKEIAQLSKTQKRNERIAMKESAKLEKDNISQNSQNSSDNDSPNTN